MSIRVLMTLAILVVGIAIMYWLQPTFGGLAVAALVPRPFNWVVPGVVLVAAMAWYFWKCQQTRRELPESR